MGDNMLEPEKAFVILNTPQVIEERNKLIAARIGKELGYGAGKMQKLFDELNAFSSDPKRIVECIYSKFWPSKVSRDAIQSIINRCHEKAFEAWQETYMYTDVWVDD
jgi:hypothetical protein